MTERLGELICDTECYPNFWSIGFLRSNDGKLLVFEHSVRKPLTDKERAQIAAIMRQYRIVGYNFQNYDAPMIAKMLSGASNAELKSANDRIIVGKMKHWHSLEVLGVAVPRDWDMVDLMPVSPAPPSKTGGESFPVSLKMMAGRLHSPTMQDLPYGPDSMLTDEQMDNVLAYMGNDLAVTAKLREALVEPLALREVFSRDISVDLMSKSDAQMGEAIIKKRVENATGERVFKVETPAGTTFNFKAPSYLTFTPGSQLQDIFERVCRYDFMVKHNGKVELPDWLSEMQIPIGDSIYQMGIGGLHSTESKRAVHADDDHTLVDVDVASYYPAIIINSGLYPKSLGPEFIRTFDAIRQERVIAKGKAKETEGSERERWLAIEKGLKIALNGCFGKLGSPYSVLYAPHLMITTTLTGQFALLMLIQRAEAMGISVVSGNTDGVVLRVPRDMMGPIEKDRVTAGDLKGLIEQWEADTGFVMEATEYQSLYNLSVNTYIATKPDGKVKRKGTLANPYKEGMREQLMKNPGAGVCSDAVVELITKGTDIETYIRSQKDIRDFVTVVKVTGGGTWRGDLLGKTVRYMWSTDGDEILLAKPHETTGNFKKVPKTDGCRPLMVLPDKLPDDIDYDRYIAEAREILMDITYDRRPPPIKPIRIYKYNAIAWFALAV